MKCRRTRPARRAGRKLAVRVHGGAEVRLGGCERSDDLADAVPEDRASGTVSIERHGESESCKTLIRSTGAPFQERHRAPPPCETEGPPLYKRRCGGEIAGWPEDAAPQRAGRGPEGAGCRKEPRHAGKDG